MTITPAVRPDVLDPDPGLCPVCGVTVHLLGFTTDGRVYATCGDAFRLTAWLEDGEDS